MVPRTIASHAHLALATLLLTATLTPAAASAQDGPRVRHVISIGNYPRVDGLRLNFRDSGLDLVRGANITIWTPYDDDFSGTVKGLALGLPSTGAGRIQGLGAGIFGVAAANDLHGIAIGGIGVGAGDELRGIAIGGIGAGVGGDLAGIAAGGIGVGAGGNVRGLVLGGIGAGAGGDLDGIAFGGVGVGAGGNATGLLIGGVGAAAGGDVKYVAIGGIGVGAGRDATGLLIGGIGAGVGGDATGILIGGVGVGAGGTVTGLAIGGVGVGAGDRIHGVAIGVVGVGAPAIEGVAIAGSVGAEEVHGVVIAPVFFRTAIGGRMSGASLGSVNIVRGDLHGFTIGLVNYAYAARGVQFGVVNIIRDNPRARRVLPIVNWGSR